MNTKMRSLVSLVAPAAMALGGCMGRLDVPPQQIGLDELSSETIDVMRDGAYAGGYPRALELSIPLPSRGASTPEECAVLAPDVSLTMGGRPPTYLFRGGASSVPGFFGGLACEAAALVTFEVGDAPGPVVVRLQQGSATAEIEVDFPALQALELKAPVERRVHPGDLITVRIPQSFYDTHNAPPPTPHDLDTPAEVSDRVSFRNGLFVLNGTPLGDRNGWVLGSVGISPTEITVRVPTYAPQGPHKLYLDYAVGTYDDWQPMAVNRCAGLGGCKGAKRETLGVLGPIDITIE